MIKNLSNSARILIIMIFFFMYNNNIYSQKYNGAIKGKIIDASTSSSLPAVNILIKGTNRGTMSDSTGEFLIHNLPPGTYQLVASAVGYKSLYKNIVSVSSQNPTYTVFKLHKTDILLPEIKVNSSNIQHDPYEITSNSYLSNKEIKSIPGSFNDVMRTISVLPGIAKSDAFRNDLIVRGGGPSENLFLIDGIPVPNINHYGSQGATGGSISFINLDYVNNLYFSSGGFSSNYGDKLSSVLSIDLREGRDEHFMSKALFSFTGLGFSAEGPVGEKSNFIFSARRSYLDIAFKLSGFLFTPEYYDVFSSFNSNVGKNSNLSFMFIGSFDKVKFFSHSEDIRRDNPRAIGSKQLNYITGLTYKIFTQKNLLQVSLSRNVLDYNTIPNIFFENNSYEAENVLIGKYIVKLSDMDEVSTGITAKIVEFNTALNLKNFTTTYDNKLSIDSLLFDNNFYKFAFFTNYNHYFSNGALINLGLRYDYFSPIKEDYTISPRFSFMYPITESLKFNISSGIYYQTPSYIWLAGNYINKRLKSLRADHYIFGLDYTIEKKTRFNLEVFHKYYRNYPASITRPYLVLANTGAGFSGVDDNFEGFGLDPLVSEGKGRSRGASFHVEHKSLSKFDHILVNVTYTDTYFMGLDREKRPGSYEQKWIVNLLAGYKFSDTWDLHIKFSYATGRPYTPFNTNGRQEISYYNSSRFEPQHSLDLRIDKNWKVKGINVLTFLDIQNIYNKKSRNFIRWDNKLRRIADDPIMGILPSIGIITEF